MGLALPDDEMPLLKQNNAILALSKKEAKRLEPSDCIRCGRCASVCPMGLTPPTLAGYVKLKDTHGLLKTVLWYVWNAAAAPLPVRLTDR